MTIQYLHANKVASDDNIVDTECWSCLSYVIPGSGFAYIFLYSVLLRVWFLTLSVTIYLDGKPIFVE